MQALLFVALQGIAVIIDVSMFGPGVYIKKAELDGNPQTLEWIVNGQQPGTANYGLIAGVSDRCPAQVAWFDPRPIPAEPYTFGPELMRDERLGIDRVVFQTARYYIEVPVAMPRCRGVV